MEFLYGGVAEAAVKSVMGTPEYFIMESQDGDTGGGDATGCEVALKPLVVPEFIHCSEDSPVQEADLGSLRRFDLAYGEVKYFKPETVITKSSIRTVEDTVRSKSVSPKRCNCSKAHECGCAEEFDLGQAQSTARSVNLVRRTADPLTVMNVEGERSSTPATSVAENMVDGPFLGDDDRNIPIPDMAGSQDGSFSGMEEGSVLDDDSSYLSTPLDSSNLCTPVGDSRESPTASFIKGSSLREAFSNNLERNGEGSKPVLVAANSKRKFQHMVNSESGSNSGTPKSRDTSTGQLSTLVDDSERDNAGDAEERRKSLISAAIAADLPKFKWGDLDMEDLESMQAVSKNDVNIDSKSATSSREFQEEVGLDAQEITSSDVVQEVRGFDSPDDGKEQKAVFSLGQQTDFPGFSVPRPDLQEEVGVAVSVQTLPEEISTGNEAENPLVISSKATKLGAAIVITESSCERKISSDLAILTMGEVQFRLSSVVDGLHSVEVKNAEAARKPVISLNRKTLDQTTRSTEFSFSKQLKEHRNLGLSSHQE